MDPTIPTPTACSTVTSSSVSSQTPPPTTPFHLLEISLISAQDLAPVSKSMRTYAITWINPNRKLSTRTDHQGHTDPTWNDKFAFRVDDGLLLSEETTATVEIYTISWFKDVLVGTVRVLMSDLIGPLARTAHNQPRNTRFVALQVRRPSGNPQGILNMGVTLLDTTMRSMPLHNYPPVDNFLDAIEKRVNSLSQNKKNEDQEEAKRETEAKIQLWRSLSMGSEVNNDDFPLKPGSICNGSTVNESELCSDIGPSASIVAAELAKKSQPPRPSNQRRLITRNAQPEETGSSILEDLTIEEARAKGYRTTTNREKWIKEMSTKCNDNDEFYQSEVSNNTRHSRRNSDGGLFSCFGNAYGIEFTIVCGASNNGSNNNKLINSKSRRKIKTSEANSA